MRPVNRITGLSPVAGTIAGAALTKLAIHLLTGSRYGFFFDELYTIALSKHLDFGYLDLPPLVPLLVAGSRFVFGESLLAYHIVPAIAGALTLVFACLIVRELGGKAFAVGVTALAFLASPVWLMLDSVFCYDSIDQLLLTAFLFLVARFMNTGTRKLWIPMGATAGLAFLTKATVLFLGPGFVVAILASKHRRHLLSPGPWIALGMFLVLASPYVIWNYVNHWPTIAYWVNYGSQRVYRYSLPEYLVNIALSMGFALMPLLVAGLSRAFQGPLGTRVRPFGILFLTTFVIVFVFRTRAIMLAELCLPLIAAGAVWMEERRGESGRSRSLRIAAVSLLVAGGVVGAPLSLPLLPESALPTYARTFSFLYKGFKDFKFGNQGHLLYLTGRIGWDRLVEAVAEVHNSLPANDRARAGILTNWYGIAGAIDLLGTRYGLPGAVCGHEEYYRWGPGKGSWEVMIVVTSNSDEEARMLFSEVSLAATVPNMLPGRVDGYHIYVCRSPIAPPGVLWPSTLAY